MDPALASTGSRPHVRKHHSRSHGGPPAPPTPVQTPPPTATATSAEGAPDAERKRSAASRPDDEPVAKRALTASRPDTERAPVAKRVLPDRAARKPLPPQYHETETDSDTDGSTSSDDDFDPVKHRNERIAHGYSDPEESVDSFSDASTDSDSDSDGI